MEQQPHSLFIWQVGWSRPWAHLQLMSAGHWLYYLALAPLIPGLCVYLALEERALVSPADQPHH